VYKKKRVPKIAVGANVKREILEFGQECPPEPILGIVDIEFCILTDGVHNRSYCMKGSKFVLKSILATVQ
jgi:hypothetical protein